MRIKLLTRCFFELNLGADDVAVGTLSSRHPVVEDVLANLGRFPTTGVASDQHNTAVVDTLKDLSSACCNWKRISLLLPPHQLRAGFASFTQIIGEV